MKLKEFFNVTKNKANNQDVLTLKKRKLKLCGISKQDLLDIELKYLKRKK